MTETTQGVDYLVSQKDQLLSDLNQCYDINDRFMCVCVNSGLLRQVAYALTILAPMWVSEKYGYKTNEIVKRIKMVTKDSRHIRKEDGLLCSRYDAIDALCDKALTSSVDVV